MSKENYINFYEFLKKNAEEAKKLQEAVKAAKPADRKAAAQVIASYAKKCGYEFDAEELISAEENCAQGSSCEELSGSQLENINGGGGPIGGTACFLIGIGDTSSACAGSGVGCKDGGLGAGACKYIGIGLGCFAD